LRRRLLSAFSPASNRERSGRHAAELSIDRGNAAARTISEAAAEKRYMLNRGLTPVLDSPEHFAKTIENEAALGLDVVKASGLYPDVK
jgi:tripartite-type tricarboxylate transporter receptor subunit TctC